MERDLGRYFMNEDVPMPIMCLKRWSRYVISEEQMEIAVR